MEIFVAYIYLLWWRNLAFFSKLWSFVQPKLPSSGPGCFTPSQIILDSCCGSLLRQLKVCRMISQKENLSNCQDWLCHQQVWLSAIITARRGQEGVECEKGWMSDVKLKSKKVVQPTVRGCDILLFLFLQLFINPFLSVSGELFSPELFPKTHRSSFITVLFIVRTLHFFSPWTLFSCW